MYVVGVCIRKTIYYLKVWSIPLFFAKSSPISFWHLNWTMMLLVVISTSLIFWKRIHHFLALGTGYQREALLSIIIIFYSALKALIRDIIFFRDSYLK